MYAELVEEMSKLADEQLQLLEEQAKEEEEEAKVNTSLCSSGTWYLPPYVTSACVYVHM